MNEQPPRKTENIGHTGNPSLPEELREEKVRDFNNTTLSEAIKLTDEQGNPLLTPPDSVAGIAEEEALVAALRNPTVQIAETQSPVESSIEKKSKKGLFIKLGATAAGLLIAAGAVFGISNANNANNEPPKSEPVAEAPADPSEPVEVAPEEPATFEVFGLPSVSEIEISAEQTDEEIAQELVTLHSDWITAGANREMYDLQFEGENGYLGLSEYVDKVAAASDAVYEEALYGDNVTNPLFKDVIDFKVMQHKQVLMAHYQTYGTQNVAPYMTAQHFVSLENAVTHEDGTTVLFIDTVREDNGDENIVAGSGNGSHSRATYVISKIDGKVKIVEPPLYVDQQS